MSKKTVYSNFKIHSSHKHSKTLQQPLAHNRRTRRAQPAIEQPPINRLTGKPQLIVGPVLAETYEQGICANYLFYYFMSLQEDPNFGPFSAEQMKRLYNERAEYYHSCDFIEDYTYYGALIKFVEQVDFTPYFPLTSGEIPIPILKTMVEKMELFHSLDCNEKVHFLRTGEVHQVSPVDYFGGEFTDPNWQDPFDDLF